MPRPPMPPMPPMDMKGMPHMDEMPPMDMKGMPPMDMKGMPPMGGMEDMKGMPPMGGMGDMKGMPPMGGMGDIGVMPSLVIEYVWLGGNKELRSKTRVIQGDIENFKGLESVPEWNYDGSSTCQASGDDSEVILKPRSIFMDPFRYGNFIVLCDTWKPDDTPQETNRRHWAVEIFDKNKDAEPWFGLEQEYFLKDKKTGLPLGMSDETLQNGCQGKYYCGNGCECAFGRDVVEEHLKMCLAAGLKISGINAEVAPGQWEFQIGPSPGIEAGDHLWMARFLLLRAAEKHGVLVDFHPKPLEGNWNGSGCHINYSTKDMRSGKGDKTGLDFINDAIDKLEKNHAEHMKVYGADNDKRMTGAHETADYNTFSRGVANRGASVRIGHQTLKDKKGYFEDRRPASNVDPYEATAIIFDTTVNH